LLTGNVLALKNRPKVSGFRNREFPGAAQAGEEVPLEVGIIKGVREVLAQDGALYEEGVAGSLEGGPGDFGTIGAENVIGTGFNKTLAGGGFGGRAGGIAGSGAGGKAAGDACLL
jgi:hypothetical protein